MHESLWYSPMQWGLIGAMVALALAYVVKRLNLREELR